MAGIQFCCRLSTVNVSARVELRGPKSDCSKAANVMTAKETAARPLILSRVRRRKILGAAFARERLTPVSLHVSQCNDRSEVGEGQAHSDACRGRAAGNPSNGAGIHVIRGREGGGASALKSNLRRCCALLAREKNYPRLREIPRR